ncbi:MAG: Uma2 family endonuclease [Chloroflexi bacterium]|nr:Uma2 family endonuclease [Chloroflexota bacterium]
MATQPKQVWQAPPTVEDVLRLASKGQRYELVDGELVEMAPTGLEHAEIELEIGALLRDYVRQHRLGKVFAGEALFRLDPAGRLARAADIAFIQRERLPSKAIKGAFPGAPDLAVEIVSPGDSPQSVQRKVDDWLSHGASAVLVVHPDTRSVVLHRPDSSVTLRGDDELSLDPVLPGFRVKVSELFPPELGEIEGANEAP